MQDSMATISDIHLVMGCQLVDVRQLSKE